MFSCLARIVPAIAFFLCASAALGGPLSDFGVILMHGKQGKPGGLLRSLARELESAGASVVMPEMPWSGARIYDKAYNESMEDIDKAVAELREAGKTKIVVGGLSLGANAAVGYAARRNDIDAVLALAPGHFPESPVFVAQTGASRERAASLVAGARTELREQFTDFNQGNAFAVTTTPDIYLSYLDPDGPASFRKNASAMNAIPLFMAVGQRDRAFRFARSQLYEPAAKHPDSRYFEADASHRETPEAAKSEVRHWLQGTICRC